MAKKCENKKPGAKESLSISVDVLQNGEGFIMVSYSNGQKYFQGVLVDANRSGLPCGVKPPAWYDTESPGSTEPTPAADDPYHTISTRMTYFQSRQDATASAKRTRGKHAARGGRSSVRLRPRQVLCSNCRSICTESSEKVQQTVRGRRGVGDENADPAPAPPATEHLPSPRPMPAAAVAGLQVPRVPIVRLSAHQVRLSCRRASPPPSPPPESPPPVPPLPTHPPPPAEARPPPPPLKLTVSPIKIVGAVVAKREPSSAPAVVVASARENVADEPVKPPSHDPAKPPLQKIKISGGAIVPSACVDQTTASDRRTGLRKRRLAIGSMEDLWDESVFVDGARSNSGQSDDAALTPVLKISFGGREGAEVMKIPAKCTSQSEPTSSGDVDAERARTVSRPTASAKAARRALKKARKDVQRKLVGSPRTSPAYPRLSPRTSPAYPRLSPLYPQMSPAYYRIASTALGVLGSPPHPESTTGQQASPAATAANSDPTPAAADVLRRKRHKHKLKHKRRKRQRERDDEETTPAAEVHPPDRRPVEMKERCLSQKLSISLRRIRSSEYEAGPNSATSASPEASEHEASEQDCAPGEQEQEQAQHGGGVEAASCALEDGTVLRVDDVVWGKLQGFPWWPGKVTCISAAAADGDSEATPSSSCQEARVSWYGSSTSSLLPCSRLLPFLRMFESRVNRKRRGPYREAIRLATLDAHQARSPAAPSSPGVAGASVPSPATAAHQTLAIATSPREVDVAS